MFYALQEELNYLSKFKNANQSAVKQMKHFLENNTHFVQVTNAKNHFCAFFVPIDLKSNRIFIGHHIKADDWIPPGGHIEKGEKPVETVYREFNEELDIHLTKEKIILFDASITYIKPNPLRECRTHFDLWYAVVGYFGDFDYDKREFSDAYWMNLDEAIAKTSRKQIRVAMTNLKVIII